MRRLIPSFCGRPLAACLFFSAAAVAWTGCGSSDPVGSDNNPSDVTGDEAPGDDGDLGSGEGGSGETGGQGETDSGEGGSGETGGQGETGSGEGGSGETGGQGGTTPCATPAAGSVCSCAPEDSDVLTCRYASTFSAENCVDLPASEGWNATSAESFCLGQTGVDAGTLSVTTGDSCLFHGGTASSTRCVLLESGARWYAYGAPDFVCTTFMGGTHETGPFCGNY